jgi:hypothetical protein
MITVQVVKCIPYILFSVTTLLQDNIIKVHPSQLKYFPLCTLYFTQGNAPQYPSPYMLLYGSTKYIMLIHKIHCIVEIYFIFIYLFDP